MSPVVQSLGVGLFGRDFGWPFAATVLSAHAAYGAALGGLLRRRPLQKLADHTQFRRDRLGLPRAVTVIIEHLRRDAFPA